MNSKKEVVLNDIAREIYGRGYEELRSVEQDEGYCIAEDSGLVCFFLLWGGSCGLPPLFCPHSYHSHPFLTS